MSSTAISPPPNPAIRAYLGGSFDPVHLGHLQMALAVYERLTPLATSLNQPLHVALMPNARSPFKDRSTDPNQRLAMLELATVDTPLAICTHELWQEPPVYTIDTVKALRQQYPNDTLIFIMGADSAATLDKWKQGLALTDYVHLWVFDRYTATAQANPVEVKNEALIAKLPDALQANITDNPQDLLSPVYASLKTPLKGRIYKDKTAIAGISSTQVRKVIADGASDTLTPLLPSSVYHYIQQQQLYSDETMRLLTRKY